MQIKTNIKKTRTLKDFTRILIGFICCLMVLSCYQQFILYDNGVIDVMMNKTIGLLIFNHLGFAAILSFIFLLVFRFLERSKPGMGFRVTIFLFSFALLFEALLVENFVRNYTLLQLSDFQSGLLLTGGTILRFALLLLIMGVLFYAFYKLSWFLNRFIGKMFPFTIILFLMVMGASVTDKKPINQNKSAEFIGNAAGYVLNYNKYEGEEFPLLREWDTKDTFFDYFKQGISSPNIVIVVIDGLSNEFLRDGKFGGFTPFLDSLAENSLYWNQFLANSTSEIDAVTNILGSLPQGNGGFSKLEQSVNRNTLYGLLKSNGYQTGFYYGGNAALANLNRFLKEEQVDVVIDKSRFNDTYKLQEVDRAGVTLGYPDGELYKKWGASYLPMEQPKLEFFLNLSTSKPFSIPELTKYTAKAEKLTGNQTFEKKEKRFIRKNIELFATLNYTDSSLERLFKMYRLTKEYENTVFLITGSGKSYLPSENVLKEHQVPLLVYSPLLKQSKTIEQLVSHHDIAPSLLQLVGRTRELKLPEKTSWLGRGLAQEKSSVLLTNANDKVGGLVQNNHLVYGRNVSKIGSKFELFDAPEEVAEKMKKSLKQSKAIDTYITQEDKIIPKKYAVYETGKKKFSKEETVWISSVFSGKNFDNAYTIARKLAHEGNYGKSLLLTSYILENAPAHIDAMILQGRIYAWKKHYNKSITILEEAVDLHPFYQDGYAALLDVYFWSGNNARASYIYKKIKENQIETVELIKKVERCMSQIKSLESDRAKSRLAEIQFDDE